jgi:MFS superfamily sulfate permease-like transporter
MAVALEVDVHGNSFVDDLIASFAVCFVALPLCVGMALATGAPPVMGLIAGVIGGIVVGGMSGAPLLVSGPAAGLAIVGFDIVRHHGLGALGVAVVLAGVLQLVAARMGLAQWFRAVAPAVMYALLAGIGVLLVLSQLHVMADATPVSSGLGNLLALPDTLYKAFVVGDDTRHHVAARVGAITLGLLTLWHVVRFQLSRELALVPVPFLVLVGVSVFNHKLQLGIATVEAPASFFAAFTLPSVAGFASLLEPRVLAGAVALALVASAEALLGVTIVDRRHSGPRGDRDRELRAQGLGNVVSGLLGGLPVTGVVVRTSTNVDAGARTRRSAMLQGLWILVAGALFPTLVGYVPKTALAAVMVHMGILLIDPEMVRTLAARSRWHVAIFAATLVAIVVLGLVPGAMVGVVLSVTRVYRRYLPLEVEHTVRVVDGRTLVDLHLRGAATFLSVPRLAKALDGLSDAQEIRVHTDQLTYIDQVSLEVLAQWEEQLAQRRCSLVIAWAELKAPAEGVATPAATSP